MNTLYQAKTPKVALIARDYQTKDVDESFRLWDSGERGVLTRIFTGGGKTPVSCMKMLRWLERGPNYYAMVISYEVALVWQFAQEIEDFTGITPGIEQAEERVDPDAMPRIIVCSRPSLLPAEGITAEQVFDLGENGIRDVEWLPRRMAKRVLRHLANGGDPDFARDEIERLKYSEEAKGGSWSRLHKFNPQLNWLLFFDEAHRHAHSLKSVGHIVDWFDQNPLSKRNGLTATPKRGDQISIGHKMFPGVAIDFPLYHVAKPCATKQGWAVPYVQKYIEVEGVDFKGIKKIAGDFDEAELERILGEEGQLAKLVEPLLDMVGDRHTLIFNPGIEMAKSVALYINARAECECPECKRKKWYSIKLIGDGAKCECGYMLDPTDIVKKGEQARSINGGTPPKDRKAAYHAHQSGQYQFLSVCGLCREGYNDPDISCVAVFRPVSKKASSLAEQMKGRGCRPCRSIVPVLNELMTPEERVEALTTSEKPNCLIVDLVGITGLADCASTIQIYADGLDDEAAALAGVILEEEAAHEETDVADVVKRAQEQVAAEREEKERKRREEKEAAAKAQAEVKYTAHDAGAGSNVDPNWATDATYKLMAFLGMNVLASVSQRKAGRIINMLKQRMPLEQVAYQNGIADQWEDQGPTKNQLWRLGQLRIHPDVAKTGWDASQIIGAALNAKEFESKKMAEIRGAADNGLLTGIGKDVLLAKRVLAADAFQRLVEAGKQKRAALVS